VLTTIIGTGVVHLTSNKSPFSLEAWELRRLRHALGDHHRTLGGKADALIGGCTQRFLAIVGQQTAC
jgi:hypothetical protein